MAIFILSFELKKADDSKHDQVIELINQHQSKQLAPTTFLVNLDDKDMFQERWYEIIGINAGELFIAEIGSVFSTRRDVKVWIRSRDIL